MMAAVRPDKRTYSGATEKTRGGQRGWKWQKKTDRRRRALEYDNSNGKKADKGWTEAVDNGGVEMVVLGDR